MASKRKSVAKALSSTSSDSSLDSDDSGHEKGKLILPGGINFDLDASDFERRVKKLKPPSEDSMSSEESSGYIKPDLSGDVHRLLNKTYAEEDFLKKQRLPLPVPDELNTRTTRSKTAQSSTHESGGSGKVRSTQHKNSPKQPRLSIEQKTTTPTSPGPKSRRRSSSKQLRHVTPAMKKQYSDNATTANVSSTKSVHSSSASTHSEPTKLKTKNGDEKASSISPVVSITNSQQLLCVAPKSKVLHSTPIDSRRAAAFPDMYKLTPIASQMGTEMFTVPRPVAKRNTLDEETDSDVPHPSPKVFLQSGLLVGSTTGSGSEPSTMWDFKRISNWIPEPNSQMKSSTVYDDFDAIEEPPLPRRPSTSKVAKVSTPVEFGTFIKTSKVEKVPAPVEFGTFMKTSKVEKVAAPVEFGTFIKETLPKEDIPKLKQNSVSHKTAQETTSLEKPINEPQVETITTNGDATDDNTFEALSSSNSSCSPHGRKSVTDSLSENISPPSNSEVVVYARKSLPVSPAVPVNDKEVEKEQDESADATSLFEKSSTHTLDTRLQTESMKEHGISAKEKINLSGQQQKMGETSKHRQLTSTALKDNLRSQEGYLITKQQTASSNLHVGKSHEKSSTDTINDSHPSEFVKEKKRSINVKGNSSRHQDEMMESSKQRQNTYDACSSSNSSCSPHRRESSTNSISEIRSPPSNSEVAVYARKSLPVVPVIPVNDKEVEKEQEESADETSLFEKSTTHTIDTCRQSESMKKHEISSKEKRNPSDQQQKVGETSKRRQSTSTALKDNLTSQEDYLITKQQTTSSNLHEGKPREKSSTHAINDSRQNESVKECTKSISVKGNSSRQQDEVIEPSKQKQSTSTPQEDNLTLQKVKSSLRQRDQSETSVVDLFVGSQEEYLITKQHTTSSNLNGGKSLEKSSTHAVNDSRPIESVKEYKNVKRNSSRRQDEVGESSKQKQLPSIPQEDNFTLQKVKPSLRQRDKSETSVVDLFVGSEEDSFVGSNEDSVVGSQEDSFVGNQEDSVVESEEDSVVGSQEDSVVESQEDDLITKQHTAHSNLNGGKSQSHEKSPTHTINDSRPSESVKERKKSVNVKGNSSRQQDEVGESSKHKQFPSTPEKDNLTLQKVRSSSHLQGRSKRSLENSFVESQKDDLITKQHTASSNVTGGKSLEKSSTRMNDSRQNKSAKENKNVKGNSSRQQDEVGESSKQKRFTSTPLEHNLVLQKVRSSSRQRDRSKTSLEDSTHTSGSRQNKSVKENVKGNSSRQQENNLTVQKVRTSSRLKQRAKRSLEDSFVSSQKDDLIAKQHKVSSNLNAGKSLEKSSAHTTSGSRQNKSVKENEKGNSSRQQDEVKESSKERRLTSTTQEENLTVQKARSSSRQQERAKRSLEDSFVGSQEEYLITKQQKASTYLNARKSAGKPAKVNVGKKPLPLEHSPLWVDEFSDSEMLDETVRSRQKTSSPTKKLKFAGKPLKSNSRKKAISSSSSTDEDKNSSRTKKLKSAGPLKSNSRKKAISSSSSTDEDKNSSQTKKLKLVGNSLKSNSRKKAVSSSSSTDEDEDLEVVYERVRTPHNISSQSTKSKSDGKVFKANSVKKETSPDHYSASSMDEGLNTGSQMFSKPQSGSTKLKPTEKSAKENSPKKAALLELSTLSVDDDSDMEIEQIVSQGQKTSQSSSRSTKLKPEAVKRLFDHISKTVESPVPPELLPSSRPKTRKRAGSRIPGNSSSQSSVNPSEIYGEFLVSRSRSQDSTLASKANATVSNVAAGPSKMAHKEDSPPPSPILPTADIPTEKQPLSKEEYFKRLNEELDRRGIQERLVVTDPNFIDKDKLKMYALVWGGANLTEGEVEFFQRKCNEQALKIVNGLRANSSLPGKVFTYKDLQATLVKEGLIAATVTEPRRTMVETWTTKQQLEAKKIGLMPLSKCDNPDMIKISFLKSND